MQKEQIGGLTTFVGPTYHSSTFKNTSVGFEEYLRKQYALELVSKYWSKYE
jgi:hypothetical protein